MEIGGCFHSRQDRADSVTISLAQDVTTLVDNFRSRLERCIEEWRKDSISNILFEVPTEKADIIVVLNEMGFKVHHAVGDNKN